MSASLSGSSAQTALRAASLAPPQPAISANVRPHPWHQPLRGSITQMLVQGENITAKHIAETARAANVHKAGGRHIRPCSGSQSVAG